VINKRTIKGVLLCMFGIVLVKTKNIFLLDGVFLILTYSAGIFICFYGLAVFSSGLKTRIIQKVKICPNCFYKSNEKEKTCNKCKKELF
jgi:cytochrome c biogenesis protein CcdA